MIDMYINHIQDFEGPKRFSLDTNQQQNFAESDDFTLDVNGQIIGARLAVDAVTSYSKNEVIGRSISIFYNEEDNQRNLFKAELDKAKAKDEATSFGQRLRKNQNVFFGRMDFYAFRNGEGNLIGFRLTVADIERQNRALCSVMAGARSNAFSKLPIPTRNGYMFIDFKDIIRCESNVNYTTFHLIDGTKIIASKTIGQFEPVLNTANFVRIHKSDIVNLAHIKSYSRTDGGVVVMSDNCELSLSRSFKDAFMTRLNLNTIEK